MSNMDEFFQVAARIIHRLYSTFPRRIFLNDNSFGEGLDEETLSLYRDTIIFLANEGMIRFESSSSGKIIYFNGVVLTVKGLALLNTGPDSLDEQKQTLGDRFGDLVKTGSAEMIKAAVRELMTRMATGFN